MPTITEDTQLKQQFINALQERSAPIRTEIHVSDLIFCLRKAFYRRFKNRKLSEQQLIFFWMTSTARRITSTCAKFR
jgi:hypothetical protein